MSPDSPAAGKDTLRPYLILLGVDDDQPAAVSEPLAADDQLVVAGIYQAQNPSAAFRAWVEDAVKLADQPTDLPRSGLAIPLANVHLKTWKPKATQFLVEIS